MTPLSPDLLRRFDVPGPRYTSYPTADRFVEAFTAADYNQALEQRRDRAGGADAAAVAVHPHPVLRVALLLLRLQQDHHQAPRPGRQLPALPGPRSRPAHRAAGPGPGGDAAAPGRRHAHLPVRRRTARTDGHAAPQLRAGARRRIFDRGRSAHHRRRPAADAGRPRLQPPELRRPGFRPRRAKGRAPDPAGRAGRQADGTGPRASASIRSTWT